MHCMTRRSVGRLLVSRSLRTPQTLHGTLCSQTSELDLREAHVTENRSASEDIMTKTTRTHEESPERGFLPILIRK